jgi:hypothetical protein
MKDRTNGDVISDWLIKNLEWEAPDKRPSELVHGDRLELGMPLNGLHARLYATQEFLA